MCKILLCFICKINNYFVFYFPFSRWLAIRLEFIGNLIILSAATFVVLQRNYPDVLGRINPGLAGLSISYALEVYNMLVNVLTDFIAFLDLYLMLIFWSCTIQ